MIELLIVMGIITIVSVGVISVWKNNKNKIVFKQAKEDVILTLEKARSRAETGFQTPLTDSLCQEVSVSGTVLTLSEKCGTNCEITCGEATEIYLPASIVNPAQFPVRFRRITAETSNKDIDLSYAGYSAKIEIKSDGSIYEINP